MGTYCKGLLVRSVGSTWPKSFTMSDECMVGIGISQ